MNQHFIQHHHKTCLCLVGETKQSKAASHGVEGGFDAIIVEADFDSLSPERRKRRHVPGKQFNSLQSHFKLI